MNDVTSDKFFTSDGYRYDTQSEANSHENEYIVVSLIMDRLFLRPSSDPNFNDGTGYIQQDPSILAEVKTLLITLSTPKINPELIADVETGDRPLKARSAEWYRHLLRDHPGALQGAWGRLTCIDDDGREWSEPGFARRFQVQGESESIG